MDGLKGSSIFILFENIKVNFIIIIWIERGSFCCECERGIIFFLL